LICRSWSLCGILTPSCQPLAQHFPTHNHCLLRSIPAAPLTILSLFSSAYMVQASCRDFRFTDIPGAREHNSHTRGTSHCPHLKPRNKSLYSTNGDLPAKVGMKKNVARGGMVNGILPGGVHSFSFSRYFEPMGVHLFHFRLFCMTIQYDNSIAKPGRVTGCDFKGIAIGINGGGEK